MHGWQSLVEESLWHGKHGGEKEGMFYSDKGKYYRGGKRSVSGPLGEALAKTGMRVSSEQSERVATKIKMENGLYIPFLP